MANNAEPDKEGSMSAVRPTAGRRLGRSEWGRLAGMTGFVALLHVVGWGILLFVVVPGRYHLGDGKLFGVGIALTAYALGLRHAFDADHLAAIDNTTRKLMS